MGEKGFCYRRGKVLSSISACEDYKPRIEEVEMRRWMISEGEERSPGEAGGFEKVTVKAKPGSASSGSSKWSRGERLYIDVEGRGEMEEQSREAGGYDQGERLFLTVLAAGLLLIIALMVAGVI